MTALGAAGAAIGLVPGMVSEGLAGGNDIAVFTAMCMCWSGYLSTHAAMMDALKCPEMTEESDYQSDNRRTDSRHSGTLALCFTGSILREIILSTW